MDYLEDQKKIKYCSERKELDECKCIFPPFQILEAFKTSSNPYYCFYQRCKESNVILTSLIEEGMKACTVSNCTINVGDLEISGGSILIKNKCLNNIDIGNYFKIFDINFKTSYFVEIPLFIDISYVILLIFFIFLLINIKY